MTVRHGKKSPQFEENFASGQIGGLVWLKRKDNLENCPDRLNGFGRDGAAVMGP